MKISNNNLQKLLGTKEIQNWTKGEVYFICEFDNYTMIFGEDENGDLIIDELVFLVDDCIKHIELVSEQMEVVRKVLNTEIEVMHRTVAKNDAFTQSDFQHATNLIYS